MDKKIVLEERICIICKVAKFKRLATRKEELACSLICKLVHGHYDYIPLKRRKKNAS